MSDYHVSVLLQEAINALNVQIGKKYIDATLGGGGHSLGIIEQGGRVLGIDQDEEAVSFVKTNHESRITNHELRVVRGNFRDVEVIAKENRFERVSGILFDLGVSSHQFEVAERGFSFQKNGPLDMRMSINLSISAQDLVNGLTEKELFELFIKLGEEPKAGAIAKEIAKKRLEKPIKTTKDLEEIITGAYGFPKNFASQKTQARASMRVFQALRIAVNDELNVLGEALPKAVSLLEDGGRMVVISFHSLEDRIVKQAFAAFEKKKTGTVITKKPITPAYAEIRVNRKSRSAKMRVFESTYPAG